MCGGAVALGVGGSENAVRGARSMEEDKDGSGDGDGMKGETWDDIDSDGLYLFRRSRWA
jgi:hypothetical protein